MLAFLSSAAGTLLVRVVTSAFQAWLATRAERDAGRAEAAAEGQARATETIRIARSVEDDASARHKADATDDAFDQVFRRP